MTLRTVVKAIEVDKEQPTAFIVSSVEGSINNVKRISKSLNISKLPLLRIGDIMKCTGDPYLSRRGAESSNRQLLFLGFRSEQVGENAYIIRKR